MQPIAAKMCYCQYAGLSTFVNITFFFSSSAFFWLSFRAFSGDKTPRGLGSRRALRFFLLKRRCRYSGRKGVAAWAKTADCKKFCSPPRSGRLVIFVQGVDTRMAAITNAIANSAHMNASSTLELPLPRRNSTVPFGLLSRYNRFQPNILS